MKTVKLTLWMITVLLIAGLILTESGCGQSEESDGADQLQEENPDRAGDDGDDPRDGPKPKMYGEEIDDSLCNSEFVVTPPQGCEVRELVPPDSYRGKICYVIFPGSEWETNSPVPKIIEAQEFFEKYCIFLNFEERVLTDDQKNRFRKAYKNWKQAIRDYRFKPGHIRNLRKTIKQQNPGLSDAEIDTKVEERIEEILRDLSLPKSAHRSFLSAMWDLQKAVSGGGGCKETLVVFIDEYICQNPKPTRVSASQQKFNQIGITFPDIASDNILAHELVHLLGKNATDGTGSKITWEHNKCPNVVLHTTRGKWWQSYDFAEHLSYKEYMVIIKNRAGVDLITKID